jgi:predicted ribosomally synthesized peptide with nif11-like leader
MSEAAAREFLDRMRADPSLAQAVGDRRLSSRDIVDLGGRHGLQFTAAELEAVLPPPDAPPEERELTLEELDHMGGGSWTGFWTWTGNQWTWTWLWYDSASAGWIAT